MDKKNEFIYTKKSMKITEKLDRSKSKCELINSTVF